MRWKTKQDGLAAWDEDVGEMDLRRQTQHKSETNPEQIDDEDEDPIEQIGDGAWGDGVLARWGLWSAKQRGDEREKKKMKRKKEERREAGEREKERK